MRVIVLLYCTSCAALLTAERRNLMGRVRACTAHIHAGLQSTDASFGEKLRRQLRGHANFGFTPHDLDFVVRHYAGDVPYQVEQFLDKNRDTLSPGARLRGMGSAWQRPHLQTCCPRCLRWRKRPGCSVVHILRLEKVHRGVRNSNVCACWSLHAMNTKQRRGCAMQSWQVGVLGPHFHGARLPGPADLVAMLEGSREELVAGLAREMAAGQAGRASNSVAARFRDQLRDLIARLNRCAPGRAPPRRPR